jgi:hypothetical protein
MAPGLSWIASRSTMVSDASFMPMISTSAPSRRNFKHRHVERCDAEMSQMCARETSMTTLVEHLAEVEGIHEIGRRLAKNSWPSMM